VYQDLRVTLEHLDQQELKEQQDLRVVQDLQELKEQQDLRVVLDLQGLKELLEQVQQEHKVHQDLKEHKEHQEHQYQEQTTELLNLQVQLLLVIVQLQIMEQLLV